MDSDMIANIKEALDALSNAKLALSNYDRGPLSDAADDIEDIEGQLRKLLPEE